MNRLNAAISVQIYLKFVNHKDVVFYHDNARRNKNLMTRQKLLELECDVLLHTAYSPDGTASDFYLFHSLQSSFYGIIFHSDEAVKLHLVHFFLLKNRSFCEHEILKLIKYGRKSDRRNWTVSPWLISVLSWHDWHISSVRQKRKDFSDNPIFGKSANILNKKLAQLETPISADFEKYTLIDVK